MYKVRIRFVKDGTAKYISHLDLMQVFRRAFMRIGLELAYSGGYHPHMQMNILLPLSTGFSSECELLDLELAADTCPENLVERLKSALPEGVRCLSIIESSRKGGEIAFARYRVAVEGDVKAEEIEALFRQETILLNKRTKRGESEVDIKPLIRVLTVTPTQDGALLDAVLAAGQESLNPEYLIRAIELYLGAADLYTSFHRVEILDAQGGIFE